MCVRGARTVPDELVPLAMAVNDAILQRLTADEGRTLRRLLTKLLAQTESGDMAGGPAGR
jgi:hypothetical protein